jgi:hypothetical protein
MSLNKYKINDRDDGGKCHVDITDEIVGELPEDGELDVTDLMLRLYPPPLWGAHFSTIAGPAKTVAQVLLAPGPGLDKHMRTLASAHPVVNCVIRAELTPTPGPADFHGATIRWAIKSADLINVWSAPGTQFAKEKCAADTQAVDDGGKFILTIETTPRRASEWAAWVRRYKRADAKLVFYGPEGVQ